MEWKAQLRFGEIFQNFVIFPGLGNYLSLTFSVIIVTFIEKENIVWNCNFTLLYRKFNQFFQYKISVVSDKKNP